MTIVVGEIGINASGNVNKAIELIDMARRCDPDVIVKFQKRSVEECVPRHMWDKPKSTPWGEMTYIEYKHRIEFGKEEYDAIDEYCEQVGIRWTASAWDLTSLDFLMQYGIPFIKIPSAKLTNHELLDAAKSTDLPVVLSTGMSTRGEIVDAVLRFNEADDLTLLHCNSSYPTDDSEENLSAINTLKDMLRIELGYPFVKVGYSSHNVSPFLPLAAATIGAEMIEAHICLSRSDWGSDQAASLEEPGFSLLCREIRRLPLIMGDGKIRVWPSELEKRKSLRGD